MGGPIFMTPFMPWISTMIGNSGQIFVLQGDIMQCLQLTLKIFGSIANSIIDCRIQFIKTSDNKKIH